MISGVSRISRQEGPAGSQTKKSFISAPYLQGPKKEVFIYTLIAARQSEGKKGPEDSIAGQSWSILETHNGGRAMLADPAV